MKRLIVRVSCVLAPQDIPGDVQPTAAVQAALKERWPGVYLQQLGCDVYGDSKPGGEMLLKLSRTLLPSVILGATIVLFFASKSYAIPPFARKYQTSCQTCHLDFPKLNDFGKAFKDAGFKFPADDESYIKEPPVMLGAPAYKESFPNSIWPGTMPGMPPVGLRYNQFFQVTGSNRNQFNSLAAPGSVPGVIPATDFQAGFFSMFTAGNFGSDIAFWVDDDLSVSGDNSAGGLGDAYLKFVNIGRLMKLPKDSLSLRAGQFELDLPFTQARTMNLSPYDIYEQANIGAAIPGAQQQNVGNQFSFGDVARGIELSGGHLYGGYHYSIAIFDQNTTGVDQAANLFPYVPSATTSANGGVGFSSDSSFKNIYARASYRFNLERDPASRRDVRAAGKTGPHDHTYLNLGTFYMYGDSLQQLPGATTGNSSVILDNREPYYRVGGDFSFNYRTFNVYGLYMFAHDSNNLPVDATGALIPLPLSPNSPTAAGFVRGIPATFSGGFAQADYLVSPWLMAIMRWDQVNSSADRINGLAFATNTSYFAPYNTSRDRFTPGVQFLIRANIKASFEYQIRPRQFVTLGSLPNGNPTAASPFRVNTALVALEFVY
ncbi:MAG: hypothetical protein WCB12_03040 [Bryobacteraceae bacterium]